MRTEPLKDPAERGLRDSAARTRRRRADAPRRRHDDMSVAELGSLRDDAEALAERVARASACAMLTVWIDDECRIRGACPEAVPPLPLHWIVGTYACGAALADIADDLRHERRERERAWRLD